MAMPPRVLVVPLVEAERVIGPWRAQYTEGGPLGIVAHVTILSPFIRSDALDPVDLNTLRTLFGSMERVPYALREFHEFPTGVLYLAPDPAEPFQRMIVRVCEAFPAYRPYGGEFEPAEVIPHVTVAVSDLADGRVFHHARTQLARRLPVVGVATEATLLSQATEGARWTVARRFSFRR